MSAFSLKPEGPYSLATSRAFLMGFTPASGGAAGDDAALRLAFRLDGSFEAVGVELREQDGEIRGEVSGAASTAAVKKQVARMLSLDADATGFAAMAAREPPIARLLESFPGFRPVCFASPYEAAVWGILAQRISMRQAAAIKRKLSEAHGAAVTVGGERLLIVPEPAKLPTLQGFSGISAEKWSRLQGIAAAALDGRLDPDALRAMSYDEAVAKLGELRGVGQWTAAHIYLRGAGIADVIAAAEPRVAAGVAHAYGLAEAPGPAELERLAERWKPYRMWVSVLVALALSRAGKWDAVKGRRGGSPAKRPRTRRGRGGVS